MLSLDKKISDNKFQTDELDLHKHRKSLKLLYFIFKE